MFKALTGSCAPLRILVKQVLDQILSVKAHTGPSFTTESERLLLDLYGKVGLLVGKFA